MPSKVNFAQKQQEKPKKLLNDIFKYEIFLPTHGFPLLSPFKTKNTQFSEMGAQHDLPPTC